MSSGSSISMWCVHLGHWPDGQRRCPECDAEQAEHVARQKAAIAAARSHVATIEDAEVRATIANALSLYDRDEDEDDW